MVLPHPPVAIITPTVGNPLLQQCIDSVISQTYDNVTHYLFVDGREHLAKVESYKIDNPKISVSVLDKNVGKNAFYGHRLYAASPYLVDADYICFLDEDVWLESHHVESLIHTIFANSLDWCYSLRNIYTENKKFLCRDNCESLGLWPTWEFLQNSQLKRHHIDTNCFCVKRDVLIPVASSWYGKWGQDRIFFNTLAQHYPTYNTSKTFSVNYQLGGNPNSVKAEYFLYGNDTYKQHLLRRQQKIFPWSEYSLLKIDS